MSLYSLNPCLIMFVIYMYLQKKGTKKSSDYGGWYMTTSLAVLMWVLSVIFSAMVSRHLTTIGFHQTSNHDQGFHQTSNHDGSFTRHLTTIRFHQTSNHDQGFHQTSNHDGGFTRHLTMIGFHQTSNHDWGFHQTSNHDRRFHQISLLYLSELYSIY